MSNLEKYLKSLGKQEEVKESKIIVNRNPRLDEICRNYETWLNEDKLDWDKNYNNALENHSKKEYTSKDIQDFSIELVKYQDRKHFENTGLFLSALINHSRRKKFVIVTELLDKTIDFIGYANTKDVDVKGNAGYYAGYWNEGTVSVGGNAGYCAGYWNEGKIKVNGKISSLSDYASGEIYESGRRIK